MNNSFNSGSFIETRIGATPALAIIISVEPGKLHYEWRGYDFLGLISNSSLLTYKNCCYTMSQLLSPIKFDSLLAGIDNDTARDVADVNYRNKIWYFGNSSLVKNIILKTTKSRCQIKNQASLFQFSNNSPLIASDIQL